MNGAEGDLIRRILALERRAERADTIEPETDTHTVDGLHAKPSTPHAGEAITDAHVTATDSTGALVLQATGANIASILTLDGGTAKSYSATVQDRLLMRRLVSGTTLANVASMNWGRETNRRLLVFSAANAADTLVEQALIDGNGGAILLGNMALTRVAPTTPGVWIGATGQGITASAQQLNILEYTATPGADTGGGIRFSGSFNSGAPGTFVGYAAIVGKREGAASDVYGYIGFGTRGSDGTTIAERARITSTGHLLIGTATDGAFAVDVVGDVQVGGGITATSLTLAAQVANTVFAGPASGADAAPTFRALTEADMPGGAGAYLLLAGRAGGQVAYGGTASGDDLTLSGSSHADGGSVIIAPPLDISIPGVAECITDAVDRDFSGAGHWSGANWAVSGGALVHTAGATTAATLPTSAMNAATIALRTYKVTVVVTGLSAGTVGFYIGSTIYLTMTADGTYEMYCIVGTAGDELKFVPSTDFNGGIGNITCELIAADIYSTPYGYFGVGTTSPLRRFVLQTNSVAAVSAMALYNADKNNNNGVVMSFRTDTTTTAFAETAALGIYHTDHTHATRTTDMRFFVAYSGTLAERLRISGQGISLGLATFGTSATKTLAISSGVAPSSSPADGVQLYSADQAAEAGNAGLHVLGESTSLLSWGNRLIATRNDAITNAVSNVLTLAHNTSGTAADGFGAGQLFTLESSTTADQSAALIEVLWGTATHATRKARMVLSAYDTAAREGIRIEASGTAAMLGFYGVTAIARPTTGSAAATFSQLSGNAVNDASTFDGYTLLQVVKALRDIGVLT